MPKQTLLIALLCAFVTGAGAQAPVVTRAEAVLFLFQVSQKPLSSTGGGKPLFSDVPAGSLEEKALQAAVENGMIGSNPVTRAVDPNAPVSRGEFLRMLAILFSLPVNAVHHYTDIPRLASYAPYVGIAERCSLFPVEKPTELKPENPLLLSEASGAVYTLFRCFASLQKQAAATSLAPAAAQASASRIPQTLPLKISSILSPPLLPSPNATEQKKLQIIGFVNQQRMAVGLLPLIRNPQLEQAAQAHAKDMYKRGYFSHFNPEGQNYIDRIRKTQYLTLPPEFCPCHALFDLSELLNQRSEVSPHYLVTKRSTVCDCNPRFALGENIARGQQTAAIAVDQWMASASHRQTIMQPLFRETGVGVFGDVWVQEFGSLSLE
ncbi:MAG: CAP domain-containing protein [Candidatus Peribacter sp.]|nr:CAP domain-containing protein [Candidatus Peribacter sp.]